MESVALGTAVQVSAGQPEARPEGEESSSKEEGGNAAGGRRSTSPIRHCGTTAVVCATAICGCWAGSG